MQEITYSWFSELSNLKLQDDVYKVPATSILLKKMLSAYTLADVENVDWKIKLRNLAAKMNFSFIVIKLIAIEQENNTDKPSWSL